MLFMLFYDKSEGFFKQYRTSKGSDEIISVPKFFSVDRFEYELSFSNCLTTFAYVKTG